VESEEESGEEYDDDEETDEEEEEDSDDFYSDEEREDPKLCVHRLPTKHQRVNLANFVKVIDVEKEA
jgi:hypothetical protein